MLECFPRTDASFLVHGQHALQEVDELAAVSFLRQQFTALQLRHIDLAHVIEAVEDVLPCLLAFDTRLSFMFLWGLSRIIMYYCQPLIFPHLVVKGFLKNIYQHNYCLVRVKFLKILPLTSKMDM